MNHKYVIEKKPHSPKQNQTKQQQNPNYTSRNNLTKKHLYKSNYKILLKDVKIKKSELYSKIYPDHGQKLSIFSQFNL